MSKIEKALSRVREERGNLQLVPASGAAAKPATGTALVADRAGHPETIARMAVTERRLLSPADLAQRGIIHPQYIGDAAIQAFRELRTKIIQQSQGQNSVILVTAVNQGSGSSFVAQNLGAAFAFDAGKTALVIDCNLKNPNVHRLLAKPSAPGLADYLENPDLDISEIIHPVGIARYRVIPAGRRPETPAEHFTSVKMRRLMDSVRRRYMERFIILDGPPMSDIADIRILSELADYVLIIARYGRATNTQIENCLNAVSNKKLLGVIFNDEPRIPRIR
ncbi:MAG: hypothetical protein WBM28_04415 [Burkholderiales bacterium]